MASFIGTNKEFRRYIGPRLRNLVQQFTKNHKAEISACEHCATKENLEAAHVYGRDRNEIIDLVLSEFTYNHIITVDVENFEDLFKKEHHPLKKTILILCHKCHRKYDSNVIQNNTPKQSLSVINSSLIPSKKISIDTQSVKVENIQNDISEEIKKVKRKIPKWFRDRHQKNSRILSNFLKLEQKIGIVSLVELRNACNDIDKFESNYNQMKIISDKNHAQVFEEEGGRIRLWRHVENFIRSEYEKI